MKNFFIVAATLAAAWFMFGTNQQSTKPNQNTVSIVQTQTTAPSAPPSNEEDDATDLFILFENSSTVPKGEREAALNTAYNALHQASELRKKRATKNTRVHLILSAIPNQISWSGTAGQIVSQQETLKSLLQFKEGFNDLVVAHQQIETSLHLMQSANAKLIWIGPTIHVPFQSTNDTIEVQVPQDIPSDIALPRYANRLSTFKVYNVHPDQQQKLQHYVQTIGLLNRSSTGDLDFALMGAAQTQSTLNDLL